MIKTLALLSRIRSAEVKDVMNNTRIREACSSDRILIEVWKCLVVIGVRWHTKLFNSILRSGGCPMSGKRVP